MNISQRSIFKSLKPISILIAVLVVLFQVASPVRAEAAAAPHVAQPLKASDLEDLNPLNPEVSGSKDPNPPTFNSPSDIINRGIKFAFPAAGLVLFVMVVWGGFTMVAGASNTKSQDEGKQRITAAIIGFAILFAAYWIVQLIQAVFGVKIF